MSISSRANHSHGKSIFKKEQRANFQLSNLPEDMLHSILSQIPLKEAVRTSLLSNEWRYKWTSYPKLSFDGATICGSDTCSDIQQYTQKFIENVNAVLRQHSAMGVEEFEIKFPFQNMLVDHLNNWVNFAASSQAKNLVLDLEPADFRYCEYRRYQFPLYQFPFVFFDNKRVAHLECIRLSMVSFKLPPQFSGVPSLRVLDLRILKVSANDLQHLLSNCFNLEKLTIDLYYLHDELTVSRPLSCLQYLSVSHCFMNKISFHAKNLKTFVYNGNMTPIDLNETQQLTNADIYLIDLTLEHVLTVLPRALPRVENLTLGAWLLNKAFHLSQGLSKFSHLKHLELKFDFSNASVDNLLSLAYFLRAAPFLETLDMEVITMALPFDEDLPIRSLPPCAYEHLKRVRLRGFNANRGYIELAVDITKNSPKLEVLVIDPSTDTTLDLFGEWFDDVRTLAKRYLAGKIAPGVRFDLL